jgi:hypothetical protein
VSRRALMTTAGALLIGASGFLLGQQLDGGPTPAGTLPKQITTQDSHIPIPNLGAAAAIPELSTAADRRTKPPTP